MKDGIIYVDIKLDDCVYDGWSPGSNVLEGTYGLFSSIDGGATWRDNDNGGWETDPTILMALTVLAKALRERRL